MIVLDEEPANFELVRQLLGHKNSRTTTNFYTGLQTAKAARHYDELLARRRDRRRPSGKPPRRPRPNRK